MGYLNDGRCDHCGDEIADRPLPETDARYCPRCRDCCALCGREIADWQFNGPVENDLTTCGPVMHTGCYQAHAKLIAAIGDEDVAVQRVIGGASLKWDSPAVQALLAESTKRMAQAMIDAGRIAIFQAQVREIGVNRPSSCARGRRN
jgi:hypothetical protein